MNAERGPITFARAKPAKIPIAETAKIAKPVQIEVAMMAPTRLLTDRYD